MIIGYNRQTRPARDERGSIFLETTIAVVLATILFVALYGGINYGLLTIRLARENLRATEILTDKMEVIRLCTWDQVNTSNFIPSTFTVPFKIGGSTNNTKELVYNGTIRILSIPPGGPSAYSNDMRLVSLKLNWGTGKINRQRDLYTYISRYGLQNYMYK